MIGAATIGMLYTPWSLLLATMLREQDGSLGVLSLIEAAGGILTGWLLCFLSGDLGHLRPARDQRESGPDPGHACHDVDHL